MPAKKASRRSRSKPSAARTKTARRVKPSSRAAAKARRRPAAARKAAARQTRRRAVKPPARRKAASARKASPRKARSTRRSQPARRRKPAARARTAKSAARRSASTRKTKTSTRKTAPRKTAPSKAARRKVATRKATPRKTARRRARPRPPRKPAAGAPIAAISTPPVLAAPRTSPVARRKAAPPPPPALERTRRQLSESERVETDNPDERLFSSVRAGSEDLRERLLHHTETSPELTAGDIDADWEDAYSQGDESPGGDNPTPDQDRVEDIGKALGVNYQGGEELKSSDKITERDRHRWELDPASSEDWPHNRDRD